MTVPAIIDGFAGEPGVQLECRGLLLPESLSFEAWERVVATLGAVREATSWGSGTV